MKPFQGEPIKPSVDKLMEAPSPKAGEVYLHQDIAHTAGVKYPSSRYAALITAWRKRLLREQNIDIDAVVGMGYRILDENEKVGAAMRDLGYSVRRAGRSVDRAAKADVAKLAETQLRQRDHMVRISGEWVEAGRKACKQVAIAGRVVSLPRPKKDDAA